MLNKYFNFQYLLRRKKVTDKLLDEDLMVVGTPDKSYDGGYAPMVIPISKFFGQIRAFVQTMINTAIAALGLDQGWTYAEISVSSAEILTAGSAPVTVVAAPGANRYTECYGVIEFTPGVAAYTIGGNDVPYIGGDTNYAGTTFDAGVLTGLGLTPLAVSFDLRGAVAIQGVGTVPVALGLGQNEAVVFGIWNGTDPAAGDGTALIKVWYRTRTWGTEL